MKAPPLSADDPSVISAAEALALAIHAEGRTVFTLGPGPYSHEVRLKHAVSGQSWTLRISDHMSDARVNDILSAIEALLRAHPEPESAAYMMAYMQATSSLVAASYTVPE